MESEKNCGKEGMEHFFFLNNYVRKGGEWGQIFDWLLFTQFVNLFMTLLVIQSWPYKYFHGEI